jgi:hypothetical protein
MASMPLAVADILLFRAADVPARAASGKLRLRTLGQAAPRTCRRAPGDQGLGTGRVGRRWQFTCRTARIWQCVMATLQKSKKVVVS